MNRRSTKPVHFALRGVALATALLWGSNASALGLGRLTVLSALGETLRAEIEVTSITPEEAATLGLRVASPEAYRAAGVEYNPVLPATTVKVLRKADGRSVLQVASDRAVLEPFVDVIVEANWASGRLVREYTMLFDPPGARQAQAAAPVVAAPAITAAPVLPPTPPAYVPPPAMPVTPPAPPMAAPLPPVSQAAPPVRPVPPPVQVAAPTPAPVAPPRVVERARPAAPAPAPAAASNERDAYRVRRGDTLSGIAIRRQKPGVSLDQMLVGLFRANPDAFMAENMNRLRAGTVLTVPSAEEASGIDAGNAREIIATQAADFSAYRQRLAGSATKVDDAEPSRQAKGKVQTTVDDKNQAAAPTPDRLKLSRPAESGAAAEADVSKETERKANDARLAELARNVDDLKKLKGTAEPGSPAAQAASGPGLPVPAPVVVAAAPEPAPAPPPAPVVEAPASAPAVAQAPAVVTPAPKPPAQTAEKEGPGFLDNLSDNGFLLPALGVLAALLAGLGLYRLRGRMRKPVGETSFLESRLQPDSFFGNSGGQRVDTHEATSEAPASSSMSYSLSQLDAIGDVDPVAEADVYLAYGRDLQAEEILKEAMRSTPDRLAIRTKLLEVYAKRRDTKGFELLATQVHNVTGGVGEDWARMQALGQGIDPDNALYQPGGVPEEVLGNSGQAVEALGASTVPYTAPVPTPFEPALDATLDGPDVDLDLDMPEQKAAPYEATQAYGTSADLGTPPDAADSEHGGVDFDLGDPLDMPSAPVPAPPAPTPAPAKPGRIAGALAATASGFGAMTSLGSSSKAPAPPEPDLGADLDFDLGSLEAEGPMTAPLSPDTSVDFGDFDLDAPAKGGAGDADPLARKLELADEFRQIGDLEGARDLLEEVLSKASGVLKTKAQGMLDQLG